MFQKRPLLQMPRLLENKYYVDEIYDATMIRPIEVRSREGLWKIFDIGVIDGLLHAIGRCSHGNRTTCALPAGRICTRLRGDHSCRRTDFDRVYLLISVSMSLDWCIVALCSNTCSRS